VGGKSVGGHHTVILATTSHSPFIPSLPRPLSDQPQPSDFVVGFLHLSARHTTRSIYYIHIFPGNNSFAPSISCVRVRRPDTDTITFSGATFIDLFSVNVNSVRILDSGPLFPTRLVDPPRIVLCDVVPRRPFRFPAGRRTTQPFEVVHHLVVNLLLGLGRFLLVLIVDVGEGVGSFR